MASQGGSGRYRIGYRDPDSGSWVEGIATKAGAVLGYYDAQSGTWYAFGRRGSGGDWLEATPGGGGDFAGYFDAKLGRWVEGVPAAVTGLLRPAAGGGSVRVPAGTRDCPPDYPIKGNEPTKIYHVPGSALYDRTGPEVCFRTVADAEAAGFDAPKTGGAAAAPAAAGAHAAHAVREPDKTRVVEQPAAAAGAQQAARVVREPDKTRVVEAPAAAGAATAARKPAGAVPPPPAAPPPPDKGGFNWLPWLIGAIVLAALAWFLGPWRNQAPPPTPTVAAPALVASPAATEAPAVVASPEATVAVEASPAGAVASPAAVTGAGMASPVATVETAAMASPVATVETAAMASPAATTEVATAASPAATVETMTEASPAATTETTEAAVAASPMATLESAEATVAPAESASPAAGGALGALAGALPSLAQLAQCKPTLDMANPTALLDGLKATGSGFSGIEELTGANDPEKLVGTSEGPVKKFAFKDDSLSGTGVDAGGFIEVYGSADAAKARVEALGTTGGDVTQVGPVVLRLSSKLSADQLTSYKAGLVKMLGGC